MATHGDSSRADAPEESTPPANIPWRIETGRYFRRPGGWWWAALIGVPLALAITDSAIAPSTITFAAPAPTATPFGPVASTPGSSEPATSATPTSTTATAAAPQSPSAASCKTLTKKVKAAAGKGQIRFGYKSSAPNKKGRAAIAAAAELLKACPSTPVKIRGFADLTGRAKVNMKISVTRAKAVRQRLQALGVTNPMTVTGLGDTHCVANNSSAKGRAANRRAEIVIP